MKMSLGKKAILFLHSILSLLGVVLVVCVTVWRPDLFQQGVNQLNTMIGADNCELVSCVLLGIYALLAILSIIFIFSGSKNRGERGFITVDSSETGRTRIAIGAVDQMIRQAVRSVEGVMEMKSSIVNNEDAISINANVVIANGSHVPTVTMNVQRAVRSYIELNCGVAVREVCVNVNAIESGEENGRHSRRRANETSAVITQPAVVAAVAEENAVVEQKIENLQSAEEQKDANAEERSNAEEISE